MGGEGLAWFANRLGGFDKMLGDKDVFRDVRLFWAPADLGLDHVQETS